MDRRAIEPFTDAVLQQLAERGSVPPAALLLLVRQYMATERSDVGDALGPALGSALEISGTRSESSRRAEWVPLFVEAAGVSTDERLLTSSSALATELACEWPNSGRVAQAMKSIDACLAAIGSGGDDTGGLLASAIDELERIIGIVYVPGEGIMGTLGGGHQTGRGELSDHVQTASTLMAGFAATGRLPYSMLAEELVQFARRNWWDDERGCFGGSSPGSRSDADHLEWFLTNCDAVRVLCRISALHQDVEYQQSAVVASDADYAGDARRILESLADVGAEFARVEIALYAVALGEYFDLSGG